MGMSDWVKDLNALAAARNADLKALAAARNAAKASRRRMSFVDDCEEFQSGVKRGVYSSVSASDIINTVEEIIERVEDADPSDRPSILAEYGLHAPTKIGPMQVKKMRAATEQLRRTDGAGALWIVQGAGPDPQMLRRTVGAALEDFLAVCHQSEMA